MNIIDALKKSKYLNHPRINGLVIAGTGEWGDNWTRLYIDEHNNQHTTSSYEICPTLVLSDEWEPVKFTVTIESFEEEV